MSDKMMYLAYAYSYSGGVTFGNVYSTRERAWRAAHKLAERVTDDLEMAGGYGGVDARIERVTIKG